MHRKSRPGGSTPPRPRDILRTGGSRFLLSGEVIQRLGGDPAVAVELRYFRHQVERQLFYHERIWMAAQQLRSVLQEAL